MGPSGAGKTTLLNVLTLSAFGGTASGTVELDGASITASSFTHHCFAVTQQDYHWAFLTARETLLYAAQLYHGKGETAVASIVDDLIVKMGLESCKDTRVGNQFIQGLSGGQKRRLSIAISLIKKPTVLFLDEPTSGLDAAAAANIMVEIKELAASRNMIVMATIHQPSTKVYDGFDQVMILSSGRTAYCGDTAQAPDHFASLGWPMPTNTNPAEFFLDLVNSDFVPPAEVLKLLDGWEGSASAATNSKAIADARRLSVANNQATPGPESRAGAAAAAAPGSNLCHEMAVMMHRHAVLVGRDPVLYVGRACIFMASNGFFAFVYWKAREREQDQVMNRMWLVVWFLGVAANIGVVAVFALNEEFKSVQKEIKNGMVTPVSYILAKTVLELPIMILFAFAALLVPGYALSNFYLPNLLSMVLMWAISIYAWETLAQALAVSFDNPLLGMMNFMSMWFSGFLFMGLLIPGSDLVWPLKVFFYILPLKYSFRSMMYIEYVDSKWGACKASDAVCFGRDGDEVLSTLNTLFPLVSDDNTIGLDILIVLAISLVFKVFYILQVMVKSQRASKIESP